MQYFKDKTVWITGASSGIGEALAFYANKYGAKVILSARNEAELKRVQASFVQPTIASLILPLDLTKPDTFKDAIATAVDHFQQIDILVNNAGISQRALAIETSMADVNKIIAINLLSTIELTQLVLPYLLETKGHIVNIASVMGKFGTKYRSAYAASKHGLIGYFDCLRLELEGRVAVTTILPGFVNTNIVKNAVSNMDLEQNLNQQGLSPAAFAVQAMQAIAEKKEEIFIGGFWEGLGLYLKRFSPQLFNFIIKRKKVV